MASLSVSENQFLNIGTSDAAEGDLRRAVVEGRIADVYDLLAMGTVCRGDPDNKWGPMHLAALHGWPEIVKLLCDAGASLESLSYRKNTPLCVAAWASSSSGWAAGGHGAATCRSGGREEGGLQSRVQSE